MGCKNTFIYHIKSRHKNKTKNTLPVNFTFSTSCYVTGYVSKDSSTIFHNREGRIDQQVDQKGKGSIQSTDISLYVFLKINHCKKFSIILALFHFFHISHFTMFSMEMFS